MKKQSFVVKFLTMICCFLFCFVCFSCSSKVKVTFDKTEVNLFPGQKTTITAEITGSDSDGIWSSENESVATVDNGLIKAIAKGETYIVLTVDKTAFKCKVTVSADVYDIIFTSEVNEVEINKNIILPVTVKKNNVEIDDMPTFTSSDETVATVDGNGKVHGIKKGDAVITAKYEGKEITKTISVFEYSISLNITGNEYTLSVNNTLQLVPKISKNDEEISDATFTYTSVNSRIASITSTGLLKGNVGGQTTIKVTSLGVTKEFTVKVNQYSLNCNVDSLGILKDENKTVTCTAKLNGVDFTGGVFEYVITDNSIANVNNGVVTGVKKGSTVLKINLKVDGNIVTTKEINLFVAESFELSFDSSMVNTLSAGETLTINPIVKKDGEIDNEPALEYVVSDTDVATIDDNGVIIGKKVGKITVTVSYFSTSIEKEITVTDDVVELSFKKNMDYSNTVPAYTLYQNSDVTVCPIETVKEGYTITDRSGKFVSSNTEVATVDEDTGKLTYVAAGKFTITYTLNYKVNDVDLVSEKSSNYEFKEDNLEDYTKIYTPLQLLDVLSKDKKEENSFKKFILASDLDFKDVDPSLLFGVDGAVIVPNGAILDGNGHTIKNVVNKESGYFIGTYKFGTIRNIRFEFEAYENGYGICCTRFTGGLYENCIFDSKVYPYNANETSAPVLYSNTGRFVNCISYSEWNISDGVQYGNVYSFCVNNDQILDEVYVYTKNENDVTITPVFKRAVPNGAPFTEIVHNIKYVELNELKNAVLFSEWDKTVWNIAEGQLPTLNSNCKNIDETPLYELSVTPAKVSGNINDNITFELALTQNGDIDTDYTVEYTSNDESIATVTQQGVVTCVKEGTTKISITIKKGTNVIVEKDVDVEIASNISVSFDEDSPSSVCVDSYVLSSVKAVNNGTEVENPDLTYESSDDTIATVDENGKITGHKKGTANITVNYLAISATISVTVEDKAVNLAFDKQDLSSDVPAYIFQQDANVNMVPDVIKDNANAVVDTTKSVYTSSKPSVATIDNNGKLTYVSAGTFKVSVTIPFTLNGIKMFVSKECNCKFEANDYSTYTKISTVDQLLAINQINASQNEGKKFILVNDIDFTGVELSKQTGTDGAVHIPNGAIFDGNGYTIKNMVISNHGYFIATSKFGTIRNTVFEYSFYINDEGFLATRFTGGLVENCIFNVKVHPSKINQALNGAATYYTNNGRMINCIVNSEVIKDANDTNDFVGKYYPVAVNNAQIMEGIYATVKNTANITINTINEYNVPAGAPFGKITDVKVVSNEQLLNKDNFLCWDKTIWNIADSTISLNANCHNLVAE